MKRIFCNLAMTLALTGVGVTHAWSQEAEVDQTEANLQEASKDPAFADRVKAKYSLTDAQMKSMSDAGIKGPHVAMTAQLAASSGKSIDEVIKMRTDQKMGWGKIAKELGVQPGELGKSVSSLHHEAHEARSARHDARHEAREQRKQAREEKKAERKEKREERKADRKNQS